MLLLVLSVLAQDKPYVIRVVDADSGRGVPLVELRTVNGVLHVTDNAGVVAFDEPGLLGQRVFFDVFSHGYEEPKPDGLGIRGAAFDTAPGGTGTLRLKRRNVAERLYRITGQGLYEQSVRAGLPTPLRRPALNAGVLGQDTAMVMVHRDRIRWFWGDTNLPGYPLGHFGTATATSALPGQGGLEPDVGIDLEYAVGDRGLSRPTFDLGQPGAVWIHGGFVLDGRILTQYERVKDLGSRLEHGIAAFDDATQRFAPLVRQELDEDRLPFGQALRHGEWIYFALPVPLLRVRAVLEDVLKPDRYEAFTCVGPDGAVVRDPAGRPAYAWRKGGHPEKADDLVKAGKLKAEEAWARTVDVDGGEPIHLHRGSVRWNEWRKRWVMIATRMGGEESFLGDVYYAEAPEPHGPFPKAVKVVGHRKYTFYNPVQHAFFDREGGRLIHFEGTYTRTFSEEKVPTPRYDYNQVMYRLDLADSRLAGVRD
jgi:hypothetical protein